MARACSPPRAARARQENTTQHGNVGSCLWNCATPSAGATASHQGRGNGALRLCAGSLGRPSVGGTVSFFLASRIAAKTSLRSLSTFPLPLQYTLSAFRRLAQPFVSPPPERERHRFLLFTGLRETSSTHRPQPAAFIAIHPISVPYRLLSFCVSMHVACFGLRLKAPSGGRAGPAAVSECPERPEGAVYSFTGGTA